jgi:hypothetical protein
MQKLYSQQARPGSIHTDHHEMCSSRLDILTVDHSLHRTPSKQKITVYSSGKNSPTCEKRSVSSLKLLLQAKTGTPSVQSPLQIKRGYHLCVISQMPARKV